MTTSEQLSSAAKEGHVPPSLADKAADELDALRAMLRELEWCGTDINEDTECPCCHALKIRGSHSSHCRLAKLLKEDE